MIIQEAELLRQYTTVLPQARHALLFAPHPDDEIFGCGGTLALLVEQGTVVTIVIVTDGAAGGDTTDGGLVALRADESRKAAQLLGLSEPSFWGAPDRSLAYGEALIQRITETILAVDADLLLLPSATEVHPDHQVLAFAGVEATRRLGGGRRVLFYEVSQPLPNPNLFINISAVADKKLEAMRCFPSQLAEQPYDLRIEGLNRFRSYFLGTHVTSAEAFLLVEAAALGPGFATLFEGPLTQRRQLGFATSGDDIPLVSIIIRSMDRPTLDEALGSVALQTYANCELIVVNAKGEGHRELGGSCGRFPLCLVHDDRPLTRSEAANRGLDAARGDYLIFLDDDDWFYPHHIASLTSRLEQTAAVAAYAAVRCVHDRGGEPSVMGREFDATELWLDNFLPIHAVLFRRSALAAGARFDETLELCEDWDFWLQVAAGGPFSFLPEVGATYRLSSQTGSRVWDDAARTREIMGAIYRKWRPRWSDQTVWSVMDYARSRRLVLRTEQQLKEQGFSGADLVQLIEAVITERCQAASFSDAQQRQISALQQQVQAQQQQVSEQQQQVKEQQQYAETLQQQLAAVYASASWTCSAPLRLCGRLFRRALTLLR